MRNYIILFILLSIANISLADSFCEGETFTGTNVKVTVYTIGAYGAVGGGYVVITPKQGEYIKYDLKNIVNYYENTFEKDGQNLAMVGLYSMDMENGTDNVSIRFLDINNNVSNNGINSMKVWNPESKTLLKFREVKCLVEMDV